MKLAYTNSDGGVSVVTPSRSLLRRMSESEVRHHLIEKVIPKEARESVQDILTQPADRTYRNAWRLGPGGIHHDMNKARGIHMDRLRVIRDEKLKALDLEFMLAIEANSQGQQAAIAQQKQRLRDLPANTDLSPLDTIEELKAFIPVELKDSVKNESIAR